jgi:hypothetical protein
MLVSQSKYDKDDVVTFKLVNGDEIVAKIIEDGGMSFTIDRPCTVVPSHQGIGLVQSLFTSDVRKPIVLSKNHVMFSCATIKEVENHYFQTTTGIKPVTAGSIVT